MRLAQDTGVVLMDGHGFDAPEWSVRVSLANLNADDYIAIGQRLSAMLDSTPRYGRRRGTRTSDSSRSAPTLALRMAINLSVWGFGFWLP